MSVDPLFDFEILTEVLDILYLFSNTTCNSSPITIFVSKKIKNYGQKIKVLQMKDIQKVLETHI